MESVNLATKNQVGIILAAGMGKRMKTSRPKVAHLILGKPLLLWAASSLIEAGVKALVIVISPNQPEVENLIHNADFPKDVLVKIAYQHEPHGTGHAAQCAEPLVRKLLGEMNSDLKNSQVIIGFGDTPAVLGKSFANFFSYHITHNNSFSILAFRAANPYGYGRVLLGENDTGFVGIREEKDCTDAQKMVNLCNSGFLCAKWEDFSEYLPQLSSNNKANELYLTDLPTLAVKDNKKVGVFAGIVEQELEGINSQAQLAILAKLIQTRILEYWMSEGVQFFNPEMVYVEASVTFGHNVIVEPFVYLAGKTHIPDNTRVTSFTKIVNNVGQKN